MSDIELSVIIWPAIFISLGIAYLLYAIATRIINGSSKIGNGTLTVVQDKEGNRELYEDDYATGYKIS